MTKRLNGRLTYTVEPRSNGTAINEIPPITDQFSLVSYACFNRISPIIYKVQWSPEVQGLNVGSGFNCSLCRRVAHSSSDICRRLMHNGKSGRLISNQNRQKMHSKILRNRKLEVIRFTFIQTDVNT